MSQAGDGFIPDPARDATATIQGFYYQILTTLVRWLELPEGNLLLCECGEDLDEIIPSDSITARRLEQIKVRTRPLTLHSPECLTAMMRLWQHQARNPGVGVAYRFTTTATVGKEQGLAFPRGESGIIAWVIEQTGRHSPEETVAFLAATRSLISDAKVPVGVQDATFGAFQSWAVNSSDGMLRAFVADLEWAMACPNVDGTLENARRILSAQRLASDDRDAAEVADLLTARILRLLSTRGEKPLTRAILSSALTDRDALRKDAPLLARLHSQIEHITNVVERTEKTTSDIQRTTRDTQRTLGILAEQMSAGGPALGAPPLADTLPEPPPIRIRRLNLTSEAQRLLTLGAWVYVHAGSGMGKTTLLRDILEGSEYAVIGFTADDRDPMLLDQILQEQLRRIAGGGVESNSDVTFRNLADAAMAALAPGKVLVLDNLQALAPGSRLLERMRELSASVRAGRVRLLTTSQLPPPASFTQEPTFAPLPIPSFTLEESKALLEAAGAPLGEGLVGLAAMLHVATAGHPGLEQAAISFLRRNGWAGAADLLGGKPLADTRQEARLQLARTSTQPERALAYRLSLAEQPFATKLAWELAGIEPTLPNAQEILDALTGPWVARHSDSRYELSALLNGIGREMLPGELKEAVHDVVAKHYLQRKKIDQYEAVTIIAHLIQAKNWTRLAIFMLNLALDLDDPRVARMFQFFTRMRLGEEWPADLPVHTIASLLAVQARILGVLGEDATAPLAELDRVAARGTDTQVFLPLFLAGPFNRSLPAADHARRALAAARIYERLPEDIRVSKLSLPACFWPNSASAIDQNQIAGVLGVLAEMRPLERYEALTAADFAEEPVELIDSIWRAELKKPVDARNWNSVHALLDQAGAVGQLECGEALHAPVARARAIVIGDHEKRPKAALELLMAALAQESTIRGRFLLHYTAGTVHADNGQQREALSEFTAALDGAPAELATYVMLARRYAMEASVRLGEHDTARRIAIAAIQDKELAFGARYRLEALGELAWSAWQSGNRRRAVGALAAVLQGINRLPADEKTKELFVKTAHVVSQLTALVQRERKGESEQLPDIFPGLFFTPNSVLVHIPGARTRQGAYFLLGHLSRLMGSAFLAEPLLEQGLASQTETITEMRCDHVIHNELAIIAAHRRNFPAALVHALHMDRAWLDDRSREGVGPGTDAASLAREVARSDQVMAMVYGVTAGMLDALARGQDVFEHLDELREAVGDVEDLVPDEAYWSLVFRELRSGFSRFATVRSIEEQLSALGGDHRLLRALLSLAVSFCAEAKPPLILAHQAVAFEYLTSLRKYETKILRDITEFLRRFWDGHARRDLVGAPDVLAQVTLLVSTTTTPSRAAALLLRLGQAMNAPIPVALQRRLAELASPGSEI
jgi:hypothetical protein